MGNDGVFLVVGGLFAGLGVLCLIWLLVDLARAAHLRAIGTWAEGQVVERPPDSAPSITVEFRDPHGRRFRQRSRGGSTGFPELGETTRVLYDPADPRRARLEADMRMGVVVLVTLAVVFGGLGAAMLAAVLG